ncbi:pathogenesis-related protein 1-like [Lolium rigidum]|uniref:pathogenesis-related protein 1-like n=1 Tax=Lolium rigidum TaxID=89674 RepID=UPI001F5D79D9|nr:pathogenesis-related protein 1-like [Lolium rigidum]
MASTNSWTLELESKVSAPRKFRAVAMDWHTLAPKLAPHIVESAHHVEGDGGVGSVRHYNCGSAIPFNVMKKKVEFLDVDKCECRYTLECDGVETSTWSIKMMPTSNGGSVAKVECTSKGVQDNDMMLKAKDSAAEMFKNVEAYLIANPDAYN